MCVFIIKVNTTIENICYEYCEDVMFSIDVTEHGAPLKIIAHIKYDYIAELSKFLFNHGYSICINKRSGKYYTLVHFKYSNKKVTDGNSLDKFGEI